VLSGAAALLLVRATAALAWRPAMAAACAAWGAVAVHRLARAWAYCYSERERDRDLAKIPKLFADAQLAPDSTPLVG
jgi:hypothetical protein